MSKASKSACQHADHRASPVHSVVIGRRVGVSPDDALSRRGRKAGRSPDPDDRAVCGRRRRRRVRPADLGEVAAEERPDDRCRQPRRRERLDRRQCGEECKARRNDAAVLGRHARDGAARNEEGALRSDRRLRRDRSRWRGADDAGRVAQGCGEHHRRARSPKRARRRRNGRSRPRRSAHRDIWRSSSSTASRG